MEIHMETVALFCFRFWLRVITMTLCFLIEKPSLRFLHFTSFSQHAPFRMIFSAHPLSCLLSNSAKLWKMSFLISVSNTHVLGPGERAIRPQEEMMCDVFCNKHLLAASAPSGEFWLLEHC